MILHRSIQEIVLKLQESIDNESQFEMVIRRSDVLQDFLNHSSFDPSKCGYTKPSHTTI